MDRKILSGIVLGFIAIVIGLVLLSSTADTISPLKDTYTVTNESFVAVKDVAKALTNDNMVAVSAVRNSTSTLTVSTQYNVSLADGEITIYLANGTYFADYTYRDASYVDNGAARSMISLIVLFFAFAVFAIIFYWWNPNEMFR